MGERFPFTQRDVLEAYSQIMPPPQAAERAQAYATMPGVLAKLNADEPHGGVEGDGPWGWDPGDELLALLSFLSPEHESRADAILLARWTALHSRLLKSGLSRRGMREGSDPPEDLLAGIDRQLAEHRARWQAARVEAERLINASQSGAS